ncbi:MAG: glycosyltransferase family 39 protein, partial [Chloroflexi bacterium]|nr:glycosyltransferase family 39 protein [Chloroflexota bacterium]
MMKRLRWIRRPEMALVLLLAFTLLLRTPSFFEPPWYDDEGIYAAVAHGMLNGRDLYRQILDNRPPGLYVIYGLLLAGAGYQPWLLKLGAALAVLAGQAVLYLIGRRLWSPATGLVAAALTGVLLSLPFLEGNIANAELFMLAPVALGMLGVLRGEYVMAGVCFGIAFLIKQIAGLELLAAGLAVLWWAPQPGRALVRLGLGALAPVAVAAGILQQRGILEEFLAQGFTYYIGYVQRGTRIPATPTFMLLRGAIFVGALLAAHRGLAGRPRSLERLALGLPWLWTAA